MSLQRILGLSLATAMVASGGTLSAATASTGEAAGLQIGSRQLAVGHKAEQLTWSMSGVSFPEGSLEECTVTLENDASAEELDFASVSDAAEMWGTLVIENRDLTVGPHTVVVDCEEAADARERVDIRYESRTAITKVKRGKRPTLSARVQAFGPTSKWRPGSGTRVTVQQQVGAAWQSVKVAKSDRNGNVKVKLPRSRTAMVYRVVTDPTRTTWGSTSAPRR